MASLIECHAPVEPWKWAIPFAAVLLIYFSRNTDDVLKHHVV